MLTKVGECLINGFFTAVVMFGIMLGIIGQSGKYGWQKAAIRKSNEILRGL